MIDQIAHQVGPHVAWLWRTLQLGRQDVTENELVSHFSDRGQMNPFFGRDPERFRLFSRDGWIQEGVLHSVRNIGSSVVGRFDTPDGFDLEISVDLSPEDGRIDVFAPRLPAGGSLTAVGTAAWRAAHYLIDRPRILEDHLAEALAGGFARPLIALVAADPAANTRRFSYAARARWAEDTLAEARQDGINQYVLLGAGLDTFAYRQPPNDPPLRVFEVDTPYSQAWKRRRLTTIGIAEPDAVSYVPVDFETDDLDTKLAAAGYRHDQPSVVSWTGVTAYLTDIAINDTLGRIAQWAAHTRLVFDYLLPPELGGPGRSPRADANRTSGEPWITFLTPEQAEDRLHSFGYLDIEHLDHLGIRDRYLAGSRPPSPGPEIPQHLIRGRVGP